MSKIVAEISKRCELMEYNFMSELNCNFLDEYQLASLDVLLKVTINSLKKVTKDMNLREKNIVTNMFIANLNNATCCSRGGE